MWWREEEDQRRGPRVRRRLRMRRRDLVAVSRRFRLVR